MAKAFTVASWNVEHFKNDPQRIKKVIDFLKLQKPDIFALYEVESNDVFITLTNEMPDYSFHITEGEQTQEILVGAKRTFSTYFLQKLEFKSGNTFLRPGALLTITLNGKYYQLLFLHTKSGNEPIGLGIRDDMFERALKFKKTLEEAGQANNIAPPANYLFLGDLNTMGMDFPYNKEISAALEIEHLSKRAVKKNMKLLTKTRDFTWWNGSQGSLGKSNLDHVVASEHLKFKQISGKDVDVRGWASLANVADQDQWIKEYSDHNLLFFQVEKV